VDGVFFCRGPPGYVNSVKLKAATVPHHHCSYSNAAAVVRDSVSRSGERGTASWRKSVQNALVYIVNALLPASHTFGVLFLLSKNVEVGS
jgi:hypothetical protein